MYFERNIEKELDIINFDKPILIMGIRQSGKTTFVKEYAGKYSEFIYINLDYNKDAKILFDESNLEPVELLKNLSFIMDFNITKDTVIIIDEIQESQRALTSLKYFNEANENYKIIATGSLLGVSFFQKGYTFPVGQVHTLTLHPFTYDEFLGAIKKEKYIKLIATAYNDNTLLDVHHQSCLELFDLYLRVGSMPEAIKKYLTDGKQNNVKKIHSELYNNYLADINKYSAKSEVGNISTIFNSIEEQLGKENQKFQKSKLGSKRKNYDYAIDWLIDSNIVFKNYQVRSVKLPLSSNKKMGFKLFVYDTASLITKANYNIKEVSEDDRIYMGIIIENYVAQELFYNDNKLYYFDDNKKEIDFLLELNNKIVPIEVKSSNNTKSKALNQYIKDKEPEYAIRISRKNFGKVNKIKSIPIYATFCIGI